MQLDAYIRVSKVGKRQGDSFLSPDLQRQQIEGFAKLHGHELIWHEPELDVSGGTMRRPVFGQIMERVRRGESQGVIVAKLDRFSRTLVGALNTIEELDKHGAVLVSVADQIDLSTSMGRAFSRILLVFAELERERRREDWDDAVQSKIERKIHGTHTPYGYVRTKGQPLALDPIASTVVPEIFARRAAGQSFSRIAVFLNEEAPKKDGKVWGQRNVATIIRNRAYLGRAFHGRHENKDAHEPLVTIDGWEAANLIQDGRSVAKAKHPGLLTGLVRCAACRYVMRSTYTKNRAGQKVPYYVCEGHQGGGVCSAPAKIAAHLVDPHVALNVLGYASLASQPTIGNADLDAARGALTDAEARLRAFLDDDELRALASRDVFLRSAHERQAAVDVARAAVDEALLAVSGRQARTWLVDDMASWTEDQIKDYIRSSLDSVYIRKGPGDVEDRLMVLWRGADAFEKPKRGKGTYRTTPIPWPAKRADEHFLDIPGNVQGLARGEGTTLSVEELRAVLHPEAAEGTDGQDG